ncbi:TAXI family TRAP transporter solute-binding subunit [Amphritea sp. 1_MG-2023]|uniref:TAXI family TRAP transporter solute-binding subunit n=1 Tax=Amphritea sp. 1_MG-2023 TaxID=3062670 RepID=UPI0026E32D4C|nr:TAXI family TRAP transporter solute-binding subunit [Amphritea sp. 1_MG-2023]MDO6565076.1 TAXI family TRAP transporter solute-binding subunit [Amphritea sp. 1_MG-2023]
MKLKKLLTNTVVAAGIAMGIQSGAAFAAPASYVTIGTGGQTGVYYVVGQSICRLVNRGNKDHGIKCTAPSTGGSVANLNAIRAGNQDMGVAQSDWQYHAYNGTSKFADQGANKELRAVFSVHPEPFTVIARADAGIKSFDDLKGKRVNIGNPGSGQRGTMEVVMERKGWVKDDFKLASELKASEQSQALCDNKVDAIIYTVGHPNGSIKEATTSCDAVLVPVTGPEITKLIDENAFYAEAIVPGGMYNGNDADTTTFGVGATFVSSTKADPEVIYQVVKAVFDNFDRFKRLHPAFANLDPAKMIKNSLSAPLHEGAIRYYKERGWM